jgi:hypothetical protein
MNPAGKINGEPDIPVRPGSDPTCITERRGQGKFGDSAASGLAIASGKIA